MWLFYRIFNLERECPDRANWYSARLLCQKYGATLSDVESRSELGLLLKLIGESFRSDCLSTGAAYFVDLHRYFTISMIEIGAVL